MKNEKIIEIQSHDYFAKINISRGANCICLRNRKYHAKILREPDYSKTLDNPYLYGMPILFPVNRIEGGRFEFEGRVYQFPINEPNTGCHLHGELHHMPFEMVEQSQTHVVCSYQADKENPYLGVLHSFRVQIRYELQEDGLWQTTSIENFSDVNMPVFLGFHTTFYADFAGSGEKQGIKVLTEISEEYERNMATYLPTGNKPEFDDVSNALKDGKFSPFEKPISRHYKSGRTGRMVIYDEKNDLSVVYENDAKYLFRLIYNGNADEYICMEPQTCIANCQNALFDRKKAGFDYIKPGEIKTYISKIRVTEGDAR